MASLQHEPRVTGGSNRVSAVDLSVLNSKDFDDHKDIDHDQKPGWKSFLSFVGPGFLVSLAYLDPGNMETDLQAGANHRYELLWVILIGIIFALVIQSLAANLGVSTGKHLSELCKAEYPIFVKYCLWLLAEVAVIAADIPEVIGTAFALNILFKIPVWVGVLSLGMFIPKLSGQGATGDAIALLGALVMPYFLIESGIALFVAFLINVSMIAVSGTVCSEKNLPSEEMDRCNDLNLNSASFLLKNVLGKSGSTLYAIALLASGQSSTITGTYAGQFIMSGFLDLKMRKWLRNLMTLSFELPFALIPLLKFSSSSTKMGPHKNSIFIILFSWALGLGIIGINIYYLSTAFVDWLIHSTWPKVANVFIAILVFPVMAAYVLSVIYLMLRKDVVVTYIEPSKGDPIAQDSMESGNDADRRPELTNAPYREDLSDIPFPQ
ncbi:unnamed protein product [Lactuca virosa]|uniref:Metal transporter n=1 Tax=Lactuca virosa TaxID=75947 RepID=A0AAU9N9K4_9ASTR|nr:unnamed protein product [Lactuca virosa]